MISAPARAPSISPAAAAVTQPAVPLAVPASGAATGYEEPVPEHAGDQARHRGDHAEPGVRADERMGLSVDDRRFPRADLLQQRARRHLCPQQSAEETEHGAADETRGEGDDAVARLPSG
jgi:hypothetical protein